MRIVGRMESGYENPDQSRFSGLNKSLGYMVVRIEQNLWAGIFIGFMVRSLGDTFFIIFGSSPYLLLSLTW